MSLIHPGDVSEPESLSAILRRVHDDGRKGTLAEIARRTTNGSPLDDHTRWETVKDKLQGLLLAAEKQDTARVRRLAEGILDATSSFLEDPGEYVEHPRAAGVTAVRFVVLSARLVRRLSGAEVRSLDSQRKAAVALIEQPANEALVDALEQAAETVIAARRAFLLESVTSVALDGAAAGPLDERALDVIERSGLLRPLYEAAAAFQDLPWGKDGVSGSPAPSTSWTTTVPSAPAPSDPTGGALAGA